MSTQLKILLLMVFLSQTAFPQSSGKLSENLKEMDTPNPKNAATAKQRILTSLTFQKNDAEQAMNFYVELFDAARIIDVQRWGKDGPGKEGTIMQALFELNGQVFMCSDSPPVHHWTFTPAVSIYVECETEGELERLFQRLSENGEVAMPLDNYGFSQKFGWVIDRFGVSWQLNLQGEDMKLKIERHFDVAPEKVFGAFTDPEEMIVWWTEDTRFDVDLRIGGHYTITREEGGTTFRMTGEFLEIEKPYKLRYTCAMPDFSPITDSIAITIEPDGKGGSTMIFIQEGEGIDAELKELPEGTVSESEKGWQQGFDLMAAAWAKGQ